MMDFRWAFLVVTRGKSGGQVETHLIAENGRVPVPVRSRFFHAMAQRFFHQIQIWAHFLRVPAQTRAFEN